MSAKGNIQKPIQSGLAKGVPVIMQLEALECGAASLAMVLAYYGKWVPLEQVRVDCGVSRDGSKLKNILLAAKQYGMKAKAFRLEAEDLRDQGPYPCIIHWGFNHFVVLDGFRGNHAILNDPARGQISVSWEEFNQNFTGICLMLEPDDHFIPDGQKPSMFHHAKKILQGTRAAIIFVGMTTFITLFMALIQPAFQTVFIDRLLSGSNTSWLKYFLMIVGAFCLLNLLALSINCIYSMRLQGKAAIVGNATFLWKLLHLPMQFFGQRLPGDLVDRQAANARISDSLIQIFAPFFIHIASILLYLVIMVKISLPLTIIGVASVLINILIAAIVTRLRLNIIRVQIMDQANLSSATSSGINMMETLKSNGAEDGFYQRWAGLQAKLNRQKTRYAALDHYLSLLPELISSLTGLLIMGMGFWLVMQDQLTVGVLLAFQAYLSNILMPASSLLAAGQSFQEVSSQMKKVDDVMQYQEDPCFLQKDDKDDYEKLSGHLEINHLNFGYSPLSPAQISDFNLTVHPGQRIAIVGPSGCGKSTLAKLLSGLYQPWSGEILFDGKPISQIDRTTFTSSLAVVSQDALLFEDSIEENIKMWDKSIEEFEMILAARDAQIHEDIMLRDGGYQNILQEGGRNLSGGQRQRLEVARALAQDPTICILDEATSALDAKTEFELVNAISARGITCIIIAHRLSTIRDCDEIIVLNQGVIVERGTHEELYSANGLYTMLVSNE